MKTICGACKYTYQSPNSDNAWNAIGKEFIRIDFIGRLIRNNDLMDFDEESYELSICPSCKVASFVG